VLEGRVQGAGIVAHLDGCSNRDQAQALMGATIAVRPEQLPPTRPGEYYWAELEGMQVIDRHGAALGVVSYLFETGANDVMVVQGDRERLIPFTKQAITAVDCKARVIRVDWDAED
jgi:16S rRNA processing protein RimM